MKWSKKQQAEWDRKNRVKHEGHAVNSEETAEERRLWERQEAAFEKLKKNPALLRTMINLKDK